MEASGSYLPNAHGPCIILYVPIPTMDGKSWTGPFKPFHVSTGKAVKAFFGFPVVLKKKCKSATLPEREICMYWISNRILECRLSLCIHGFSELEVRCSAGGRGERRTGGCVIPAGRKPSRKEKMWVASVRNTGCCGVTGWMRNCPEMVMEPRTGGMTAYCSSTGGVS